MFNKKRFQKLAGILVEGTHTGEKYRHNKVYNVIKHKMSQFLEEKGDDVNEVIVETMKDAMENSRGEELDHRSFSADDFLGESDITEMFLKFLGNQYLVDVLNGDDESQAAAENHQAAWDAAYEAMNEWLEKVSYDDFQVALEDIRDSEELARDPNGYYGVSDKDFY